MHSKNVGGNDELRRDKTNNILSCFKMSTIVEGKNPKNTTRVLQNMENYGKFKTANETGKVIDNGAKNSHIISGQRY